MRASRRHALAIGVFGAVVAVSSGGTAQAQLPGALLDKRYEWYAVARDCVHETALELQSLAPVEP